MEIVLKAKQSGNPQFDFLNYGNWLNPYYRFMIKEIKSGRYTPMPAPVSVLPSQSTTSDQTDKGKSKDGMQIYDILV